MSNVSRQAIRHLQAAMQNTVIIGVIIRSQNSKIIDPNRTRYNTASRAVWNFTLRDSLEDFINATVWGAVDFINSLFTTYTIGSVVELINAKITDRKPDDPNEIYVPFVTSPLTLTLSQSSSLMKIHDSPGVARYRELLRLPTKNPAGAYSLDYILSNLNVLNNEYVDIIVAVTFVSQTREIVTRVGELAKIREFEVGDASTDQTVPLSLWDSEWIRLADKWKPKQTILFLADVQIHYNERIKKAVLTIVRKTMITENPDIKEAKDILTAFEMKPDMGSISPFSVPNPSSITKQMTIANITNILNRTVPSPDSRLQLLVLVYAMVDDINIDSKDTMLISARCAKCKRMVAPGEDSCMNLECPFGSGIKSPINVTSLNVLVNLKDDTGYLIGCRLRDAAAEQAFSINAEALKAMPMPVRSKLKEKFYKQICHVRMQIVGPSVLHQKPVYNILDISVAGTDDLFEPLNVDELELDC